MGTGEPQAERNDAARRTVRCRRGRVEPRPAHSCRHHRGSCITAAGYSEDALVEQPAIELFHQLGWQTRNCYHEWAGPVSSLGRETMSDVVLIPRLRPVLEWLNPGLPPDAYAAVEEITRDRSARSPAHANRELYTLLKDGVRVTVRDEEDEERVETLRIIDWRNPANNDFFLASQFWVASKIYRRRADLVGFVNGIPLVFVELKASHKNVQDAYDHNLKDYRVAIPQLFHFNGFTILSNGSQSKIGSLTAAWEHFTDWKRINDEGEQGVISLETIIRGACDPARLLDIVENFTVFQEVPGGLVKIVGMNPAAEEGPHHPIPQPPAAWSRSSA